MLPKTVKKAIERLKQKGHVLEVNGRRNSRLFCLADGEKAEYIRKHMSKSTTIRKLNNPRILRNEVSHGTDRKQRWVIDKYRKKFNDEITLESMEYDNKIYSARIAKKIAISRASRQRWHNLERKNKIYM